MKDLEAAMRHLHNLTAKAGVRNNIRINIVCLNERDKAHLCRQIAEDIEAPYMSPDVTMARDSIFKLAGIEIRVLA